MHSRLRALAALIAVLVLAPVASAAEVPEGATWSEHYFESGDGTRLHADVLRPKGLPEDAQTPVILTVSPYLNRSGATAPTDPLGEGPSNRFFDFLEAGKVFERGYTYAMVDLRGFGGSGGCNDWGGPGEQMDTKAAVEWAGTQDWSNGKVGLYGKSYDGWTGLMGIAQRAEHLAAVVSQEPVVDGYRYLYMNGVRFSNSVATPTLFTAIDAQPGSANSGSDYVLNGATGTNPACYAENIALQQSNDPQSDYWRERNLIPAVKGATTPTFLMEGFLEDNTKPDHVWALYNNLAGPKRGWFGQWDHVRGTDRDEEGKPLAGREGYADEAMRFFGQYLKGEQPAVKDPANVVQQGPDGRFRSEKRWPPRDARMSPLRLNEGEYPDDALGNSGTATDIGPSGRGLWTFTPPLPRKAILSGMPQLDVSVATQAPSTNLVADVYDVDQDGNALLVSRGAQLLPDSGDYAFELYGQDWVFEPGHRIGVLITGENDDWWMHIATNTMPTLESGSIELPFLRKKRTKFIDGGPSAKLTDYRENAPFQVDQETIEAGEAPFAAPKRLRRR